MTSNLDTSVSGEFQISVMVGGVGWRCVAPAVLIFYGGSARIYPDLDATTVWPMILMERLTLVLTFLLMCYLWVAFMVKINQEEVSGLVANGRHLGLLVCLSFG